MSTTETANLPAIATSKEDKPAVAEIKNNKILFKQKPMSLDKQSETLQEIVQFRAMLEERVSKQDGPLKSIPDEYKPVVAKLAFESDKTIATLGKHIHHELLPIQDEDAPVSADILIVSAVEAVIKSTMTRTNYGIDPVAGAKIPAALYVWRWELQDQFMDWLPSSVRPKVSTRLAERVEAKKFLNDWFGGLTDTEREAIAGSKAAVSKSPLKTHTANDTAAVIRADDVESAKVKVGRPKKEKLLDPKEIEKQERKAAKLEKEKKEKEAQNKSRSLMANFFSKGQRPTQSESKPAEGPSSKQSDYERAFKPFVLKKDATLAPTNVFREKFRTTASGTADDVIVVDDDDSQRTMAPTHLNYEIVTKRKRPSTRFDDRDSVRAIMTQLSEAEVTGDASIVRTLYTKLADRSTIPAKVFIFDEDARPGYFGTWTRASRTISPRRPFSKDVLELDYGYDSGEEWEEEPAGDADDVADDDDEEGGNDEVDSDEDSWLDDDDIIEEPGQLDPMDMGPPIDLPRPVKRKADEGDKNLSKKRKVVVPLIPFAKGPYWEPHIGHCSYEPFKPYRIRLLNDAALPIDPFKDVIMASSPRRSKVEIRSNEPVFAVPPLPAKLDASSSQRSVSASYDPPPAPSPAAPKKAAPVAKTAFPEAHLPALIAKLGELQSGNLTFVVESIHHDLRDFKVKKNSIEAKIKEIGEKCKDTKRWRLKADFTPPSRSLQA